MPIKDDRRYITVTRAPDGTSSHGTPVGVIFLPEDGKVGGFRYIDSYTGPPISPDLDYRANTTSEPRFFPISLKAQEHLRLRERKDLHQVFMDALPGGWGETVMISHSRLYAEASPAEKLWMLGDRRVGALSFETGGGRQLEHYIDGDFALNALRNEVQRFAEKLFETKKIPFAIGSEKERWALTVNGGSTPKCAFRKNGVEYVAKFSEQTLRLYDTTRVERAMLDLSRDAGLNTVDGFFIICPDDEAVLCTRRYDTIEGGGYVHHINGATALDVPLNTKVGYDDVAQFLRENGSAPDDDVRELYGRMLFNAYINNTDDHLGQFEFVQDDEGWRLAPNLDLLVELDKRPHRLTMGGDDRPGYDVEWIEKTGESMGLDAEESREIAHRVVNAISQRWETSLRMAEVDEATIAELEPAIQPMRLAALRSELSAAITRDGMKQRGIEPRMTLG